MYSHTGLSIMILTQPPRLMAYAGWPPRHMLLRLPRQCALHAVKQCSPRAAALRCARHLRRSALQAGGAVRRDAEILWVLLGTLSTLHAGGAVRRDAFKYSAGLPTGSLTEMWRHIQRHLNLTIGGAP
jgi:hypothetical protein